MADSIIARSRGSDDYPPGWSRWTEYVPAGHTPLALGLQCRNEDLNRFAARYRLARSFVNAKLRDYGEGTAAGYSGLFKIFLVWSAFEQYLKAMPCNQADCLAWLSPHIPTGALAEIRGFDSDDRFYTMIQRRTRKDTKVQLGLYLARQTFNFSYLASGVRHVFAHGYLTPSANGTDPFAVWGIACVLADVHLTAIGAEFQARVHSLAARLKRPGDA